MRLVTIPALVVLGLLAATPASASLIGTIASTASPTFPPTPASATVVDGGSPEFTYDQFFLGDVGAASFTLTSQGPQGFFGNLGAPANAISLTLADTITTIAVTLGPSIPALTTSAFTFDDKTLTIAIGAAGPYQGGSLVAKVDFTFANTPPVPEPASLALLGAGLLGVVVRRRRAIPTAGPR